MMVVDDLDVFLHRGETVYAVPKPTTESAAADSRAAPVSKEHIFESEIVEAGSR